MHRRRPVVVSVAVLVLLAAPAAAYHRVSDEYYVYATHSDGIPIMADEIWNDEILVEGAHAKTGGYGNDASAFFRASIAAATVEARAHAHGFQYSTYGIATATGRVERADFFDDLIFTVPAGTYPSGVQVGVTGWAHGSLGSTIGANVQLGLWASLGSDVYETGVMSVGNDEANTITVDDVIVLMQEIVAPGTTLNEAAEFTLQVRLLIHRGWTAAVSYNAGGGYVTGDASYDFTNGLGVSSVDVPPGVTWRSGSGRFLTAVSGAPVPEVAAPAARLLPNVPNPFNPTTTIAFDLPRAGRVDLRVHDVAGRLVRTLLAGAPRPAGRHAAVWRGRDDAGRPVASGVYYYRLDAGRETRTRSMVLLR